ncbi:unnamed protein product [Phytomonas sp. EM1]|nr:unnamed protein product [Phytomonas sp. EM1]|eukprot:CCW61774.1 unnamed protein product [Phytomonas sp. isolate EM1]
MRQVLFVATASVMPVLSSLTYRHFHGVSPQATWNHERSRDMLFRQSPTFTTGLESPQERVPSSNANPTSSSSSTTSSLSDSLQGNGRDYSPCKGKKAKGENGTKLRNHASAKAPSLPRTGFDIPTSYTSFRHATHLKDFLQRYDHVAVGHKVVGVSERVGGRVVSLRDMGRILFLTIHGDGHSLQVVRQVDEDFDKEDLKRLKTTLRVGDIIGAVGIAGRTEKGELSLYAKELVILAPYVCTDQSICPNLKGFLPITDNEIKYRYRFLDMMTNPNVRQNLCKRHEAIRALRGYLDDRGFVEVETPVLHEVPSGANAKPFITYHNDNNDSLFLRVAPELHLKQCVVGGMERVYEIGRVFRNEDADRSHNPEFTSCELYAAYHSYEDLMGMTEAILQHMARAANGTTKLTVTSCVDRQLVTLDLMPPFHRVSVYDEIQRVAEVELPPPLELNTSRGLAYMSAIMLRHNIPLPPVRTAAQMFDKLIDFFIVSRVVQPTFLVDHPLFMSPLAKEHDSRPGLSERFELFINGMEICNAYSELNNPHEQYHRFQQQLLDRQQGDEEAMALDAVFLKALQVGLPPTAGWGMGIDRVMMLLNGSSSIRDEVIFPLLRKDADSRDAKQRRKTASYFGFNSHLTLFCLGALEDEMIKCKVPRDFSEKVRQLRKCIHSMSAVARRDAVDSVEAMTQYSMNGWRYEAAMKILKIVCGHNNW